MQGRVRALISQLAPIAFAAFATFTAHAANSATAWLASHQQADGSFVGTNDIATPVQSTAETLTAFANAGQPFPGTPAARAFIAAAPYANTELLSRRLLVDLQAGANLTLAIDALLAERNADGGFGELAGYQSNPLDTAFAVHALGLAAQSLRAETSAALAYLASQQAADGSFKLADNEPSVYLTALATRAFFEHRRSYPSAALAASRGRSWLQTQLAAGGLEDYEVAQAILAVLPGLTDSSVLSPYVAPLAAHQGSDGSWSGDAYTTALASQALTLAAAEQGNPDLGRFEGRILDGDYGTPLGGATVALSGPTSRTLATDATGTFVASGLEAGSYSITYSAQAHSSAVQSVTLAIGQHVDLGDIRLLAADASTPGTLTGAIVDAVTRAPLSGALVSADALSATTDGTGRYRIDGLDTGSTLVSVSRSGYQGVSTSLSMPTTGGVTFNAALTSLSGAQFGLAGVVSDASDATPIAGAAVVVNGSLVATTGADGHYAASFARTGALQVTVAADGYQAALTTIDGGVVSAAFYAPRLARVGEPPVVEATGGVTGRVVDGSTGQPVGNFSLLMFQGSVMTSAPVQSDGTFVFASVPAGTLTELRFVVTGYRASTVSFQTVGAATLDLGTLVIQPDGFQQPATLEGSVVDATNSSLPLAGATVSFSVDGNTVSATTDGGGVFTLSTLAPVTGTIDVSVSGYVGVSYELTIEPGTTSLGQFRLRPQGVAEVHPDLTAFIDDAATRVTDPATGVVSGSVALEVRNLSFTPVAQDFDIVAFHDADGDGVRDDAEPELGRNTMTGGLTNALPRTTVVPLAGMLPFRDAPVSFALDAPNAVLELREDNNVISTARACEIKPSIGGLAPSVVRVLNPQASLSVPVVGPLLDTDGNGKIDAADDPFVVFITLTPGSGSIDSGTGILRAINGRTGAQAWQVDSVGTGSERIRPAGTAALGDIDGDGKPEVVTYNFGAGTGSFGALMIVNNDGSKRLISAPIPYAAFRTYGSPQLFDLDADGVSEIVFSRSVFNADGTVRWHGTVTNKNGYDLATAGDLDQDGSPEVVVGPVAYRADGTVLWHNATIPDAKAVLVNLDDDPNPEVVLAGRSVNPNSGVGAVWLLDHDGTKLWGPINVSARFTGAPTVGDVDGDGEPEIGVAGNNKYWIIEGDGSVKWTQATFDSSENTGSTFFDFDGNGTTEVVYMDEQKLRVFDGASGTLIFQVANGSSTVYEFPVVADIDNDGHADLLVPSNTGLRHYRDVNNSWVRTRGIWNQYQYQTQLVNDDASLPQGVPDYWLDDNSYRVQGVPEPTAVPDLTVSFLRVVDHGVGQPMTLAVRVGNGGRAEVRAGTKLAFYQGNPTAGGVLLGTLTLPAVASGAYQDVELTGVTTLTGTQAVYVVADSDLRVPECFETNNSMSTAVTPNSGSLALALDAAEYGPDESVAIVATVSNTGSFAKAFRVVLVVEDVSGAEVYRFPVDDLGVLLAGSTAFPSSGWNTGSTLVGTYVLKGTLESAEGVPLATAAVGFVIRHDATGGGTAAASLRVVTDRIEYHTSDRVDIDTLARNLTANLPVEGAVIDLTVMSPDSVNVPVGQVGVGTLVPGGLRSGTASLTLNNAPQGDWILSGTLRDGAGTQLATAVHTFKVVEALGRTLVGEVSVGSSTVFAGEPQLCTESVTYLGDQPSLTVRLRRTLVALATGAAAQQSEFDATLDRGIPRTEVRTVATGGLSEGDYACALEAKVGETWTALDHAVFSVEAKPIVIDVDVALDGHGRLLVLLDPAEGASTEDPFGPASAPPLGIQRAHLEAVLEDAGWSATIVTDLAAFEQALATGQFSVVAVLSETVKLPETLQDALVAKVHAGLGLFVAGNHDARNARLEAALGIHSLGKNLNATGLVIGGAGPFGTPGTSSFGSTFAPNAVAVDGAQVLATYALLAPKPNQAPEAAVTANAYGQGRAVYAGFDWIAASAAQGDTGPLVTLLTQALDWAEPDPLLTDTGRAVPILVRLTNQGLPTPGRLRVVLPAGVTVADAGDGSVGAGELVRTFDLDANETFEWRFWIQMPATPGTVTVPVLVETGDNPGFTPYASEVVVINVGPQP
jgi:hypothetical protein